MLWNKEQQRNNKLLISKWKEELEQAMVSPVNDETLLRKLNGDLRAAYIAKENFWKQRSRNVWLSLGDRNSGYFHAITRGRKALNKFSVMENGDGVHVFTEKEITGTIVHYFSDLFKNIPGDRQHIVAEALTPKISEITNLYLVAFPNAEEIHLA